MNKNDIKVLKWNNTHLNTNEHLRSLLNSVKREYKALFIKMIKHYKRDYYNRSILNTFNTIKIEWNNRITKRMGGYNDIFKNKIVIT